ncbi:hypothetical protein HYT26_01455 [Candidatus Pacearchaeota archaeon]|nr:hypothetical protein [Candidatus Pacearchaeota archaeon]
MKNARKCSGSLKELKKLEKGIKKSMERLIKRGISETFNLSAQELRRLNRI